MNTAALLAEINKVVRGKEAEIKKILMAMLADGHILLEDVPGVGKTTMALAFSKAMNLHFNRIQFTPDVTASDIVGFNYFDKNKNQFVYHEGAIMANFVLGDEINRTSSRTQSALLEAMEEGAVTVDGTTYELPKPFIVLATQNPIGSAGTQPLPQAQLDRFLIKVSLGYPDFDSQVALLRDRQTTQPLEHVPAILNAEMIQQMKQDVQQIRIADALLIYITKVTVATRNHTDIVQGISPRGALAVCKMAKAHAYLAGRSFVIPEDILAVWQDTCAHRLVVGNHVNCNEILARIIEQTPTPDEQLA
ncbi:AAA family ATPase [Kurthia gibsonii]|uniref:AAA family ATPase n=1 Tax=Kurthia gibsonii TaxID=33946 RepID=UPI002DBE062B|nr:MoxR family ATPase [Kurthia gibsonii]MEB7772284.1 MoxR family ATPase [Kurthia gibsonii]